jgi:cytochrome oxidase Cu insertion factor (SCO1/SenC/PrrC family)
MPGAKPHTPQRLEAAPSRRPNRRVPSAFWAITILLGVGAGTGLALLHVGRESYVASAQPTALAGPEVSWAAERLRAPDFHLRDQSGGAISLSQFRGRPVILTFIDPLCRNLCPVEAGILDNVEKALPSSARPAIVAVSVDAWGDARANLLEDDQKWHLATAWRWAVGSLTQLEAVWRHYEIGVTVTKKEFAGITIREITHTEAAFLIDPAGYQRALYLFPFEAADVAQTVRGLEAPEPHSSLR